MLDAAWRNLVVTGRNFKFEEIDAQSIPYEDETFDAVIANHMLYHVPDRPNAIAEIKRVLKPNGHLFATTIGKNHLKEIADLLRQISLGNTFESFGSPFTLENGLEQLKQFFTKVVASRYPDSLHVTEIKPIILYRTKSGSA
jgi:ubiquinone/menaquinone biosynthesis C-methylase UbiE